MTNLHISYAAANAQAAALAALAAGGSLVIYSGAQPATPETSIGASVALCTFTLGNPAFGAPSNGVLNLNVPTPATVVANGTAQWFRVYKSDGVTALFDGNVGLILGGAWATSTAYAVNAIVTANGNSYQCTGAGTSAGSGTGPSGTGSAINDGTVVWTFVGLVNADISFNSVVFAIGNTVVLSSYSYQVPGV
jgi:hypothetical protein